MTVTPLAGAARPDAAPAAPGSVPDAVGRPPGTLSVPAARPYPWPFDGEARPASTALLVVAAQTGLARRCRSAPEVIAVVSDLAAAVAGWGGTVIATRHAASPALRRPGVLPVPGTPDAGLLPGAGVWALAAAVVVDAYGVDGFAGSPLAATLAGHGLTHLLVCGLGLEGPVHSTLRSANDRGLECLLVADACAPFDPSLTAASLLSIEMSGGIFGAVATTADILPALRPEEDT